MVPTHLGLTDGPFVPHNLISIQESPVPLLDFQMARRLNIFTSSSCKKGIQIRFIFSLKKFRKTNPLHVPNGAPVERDTRLQGTIYISLEILVKIPLNKILLPSLKGPKKRASLHIPPKAGPLWKQTTFSRALLNIYLSGSPVKEPSFQVPLMEPLRREMPRS